MLLHILVRVRIGTFNCENLFMRYRPFYFKKSNKKGNIYSKKYYSLADIPTANIESFVNDGLVSDLYDYEGFLPDDEIARKDGKDASKSVLRTLAKNGKSGLFDVEIKSLDDLYDEIVKGTHSEEKTVQNKETLLEFRTVSMQIKIQLDIIENEGGLINLTDRNLAYTGFAAKQRWNTAKVVVANNPDILALQEVENMEALRSFNKNYLYPRRLKKEIGDEYDDIDENGFSGTYPFGVLIDSNDPRLIDVALLSRFPIVSVRTHMEERFKKDDGKWDNIFSRDCLEVEVALEDTDGRSLRSDYRGRVMSYPESDRILSPDNVGKTVTVLVNHFKSKFGQPEENPEESNAWKKRRVQSERVIQILRERFGDSLEGNFVVAGDLNDSPDSGTIRPLLDAGLENIVEKDPEPWTHYYDADDHVGQFDYLLFSPGIAEKNPGALPVIERRGLQVKGSSHVDFIRDGERFKSVRGADTEASDHCGVFVDVDV